jgi:glutathione S-transferase
MRISPVSNSRETSAKPLGTVPALADGDWVLTQNAAILEYVAELAPGAKLLGDGSAKSRAEVRRWLGFINSDVHKTFSLIFGVQLSKLFALLDARLKGRTYLAGDAPSIADAHFYVLLRWAHAKEIDLDDQNHIADFFKRMEAAPAVQAALKAKE